VIFSSISVPKIWKVSIIFTTFVALSNKKEIAEIIIAIMKKAKQIDFQLFSEKGKKKEKNFAKSFGV